jgi:hypothetical protein
MRTRPAQAFALATLFALALPGAARALGDGDGFIVTLWGDPQPADLAESVRMAADAGARHVTFLVFLEQDSPSASEVRFHGAQAGDPFDPTPQAQKLAAAIADAQGRGLSAGLDPFLSEPGGSQRHWFSPGDPGAWFASYGARMAELAAWAEAHGVDELIAGSELSLLFEDEAGWRGVIAQIRGGFSGHVTISSTWPDYELLRFWDALDSIGISAYFPLAFADWYESIDAYAAAWELHHAHLAAVAQAWGKPVTFVEVGYPATPVAATMPWDYDWSRPLDQGRQWTCFEALRTVWSREPLLRRFAIWGLSPAAIDARDTNGRGFLPLGKPAEGAVRDLFTERAQ